MLLSFYFLIVDVGVIHSIQFKIGLTEVVSLQQWADKSILIELETYFSKELT